VKSINHKRIFEGSTYEDVFHKYYGALVSYAVRFVSDDQASEDLVQDVFLRLLNKIRNNEELNDVRSYLYRSVKNQCINYNKHMLVRDKYEADNADGIDNEDNYIDAAIRTEVYRQLNEALKKLPPQTQKIFRLVLDGLTSKEIAEDLQLSVETVKTQRKRAKMMLKQHLGNVTYVLAILFNYIP